MTIDPNESGQGGGNDEKAVLAHVAPFIVWLLLLNVPGLSRGSAYLLQTLAGSALLLWLRPWQWYSRPAAGHVPAALLTGLAVAVLWVLPESSWMARHWPRLYHTYQGFTGGIWKLGYAPPPAPDPEWAPAVTGWPLVVVRVAGSALVIAAIEEFFWRGFLMRITSRGSFLCMDMGKIRPLRFLAVCLLFGAEHHRWVAGIAAGMAYGMLTVKTKDLGAAVIAHGTTNGLLGIYVLSTGAYQFW